MNAVIYARYSSDRQREESIEGQLRECTDYAMKNNLTLLGTYVDRALSARTADRPDFQRMIADSAKGLFDVVLVWKLDRFSRDRYDSAHYKHVLKKNGVRVISIKENISDGPEGIILESMLEGYAEYYSAELAQKIRRGQHDNAMKCMNNGGNTPLGYYVDKATGRLEINPETAPYVQELFARYADGERLAVLQAEMEERGLRSKRGNAYTVSVLSNLLKNRKYIGEYKYGDVITPDGIPAIIDKELFERVQMRMAANKKAPARAKAEEEYLLTTKLYCGDCGRLMAGESGKGCKGIVYHYYKCSGAKRRLGCKKKAIKKHWIEETVVKLTVSKVLTDEAIDRIADAILVMQEQGDTMTPVLKQQLQQCEAEIRNVMKAIRQGIITETTKECLENLETQRDSLKASILQLQLERRKFTKEEIVEWISKYKYGNINDLDYRKEIIDTFVNSVLVYDDKLVLTYNDKDGTGTLTLQEIESSLSSNLISMCPLYPLVLRQSKFFPFQKTARQIPYGKLAANQPGVILADLFSLYSFLCIVLRLGVPKFVVLTVLFCKQAFVSTLLDHGALMEHGNFITELAGRQAMTDIDSRLVTGDVVELRVNLRFGNGIQGGSGFVQDDKRRIFVQCTGNGDLLRFTAGDFDTIFTKIFVEHGIQSIGHFCQAIGKAGIGQCFHDPFPVIGGTARHIVAQRLGDQLEVLEHNGENVHVIVIAVLANIDAIKQYLSLLGIVESAQQFDKSGFAAAILTHDSQALANLKFHTYILQRPNLASRILEGDILKLHFILPVRALLGG